MWWAIALAGAAACGVPGGGAASDVMVGTVTAELSQVPSGVTCVQLALSGSVTTASRFTVTAGTAPVSLSVGALPAGAISIAGSAYNLACASVTPSSTASWVSGAVQAVITPGLSTHIALTLRENLPVSVNVDFLATAVSVRAGKDTTYVVLRNGTVRAWGNNAQGQLGSGSSAAKSTMPVAVAGLTGISELTAGSAHACAADGTGHAFCWGRNLNGQLGNGTTISSSSPVAVAGSLTLSGLAAGLEHSCGKTPTGAFCWGGFQGGLHGELGTCSTQASSVPVAATCLPGAFLVAGGTSTLAFAGNSSWGAGDNAEGLMGNGQEVWAVITLTSTGFTNNYTRFITAAGMGTYHACAIEASAGAVYCAGNNFSGQLGQPASTQPQNISKYAGVSDAVAVAGGFQHTCALKTDGSVWCWGSNTGRLGDGTSTDRWWPAKVKGLDSVVSIAAGDSHSCAVKVDGTVWCWGDNRMGQLGDGTTVDRGVPTKVQL